jgi:hypothetical protein
LESKAGLVNKFYFFGVLFILWIELFTKQVDIFISIGVGGCPSCGQ